MPDPALHLSERVSRLGFSDIVRIRNRVLEMIAGGTPVIRLEGGEPFMPTPGFIKEAMKTALDQEATRYAPSSGIGPLIDAIRDKLLTSNRIIAGDDSIIVTSGGAHALFCAFQCVVDPGDEVMFFSPYWTPIRDQVTFSGGVPVLIPWSEIGESDLRSSLEKRLTPRTRVFYVNSPSNPTGNVLSNEQFSAIARFACDHNLIVISDEAYEDLVYDGTNLSLASLPGMAERTISIFTLSKSYSMTGWRVGYAVAEAKFMKGLRKLVLNSINGVSTPSQHAAAAAIRHGFPVAWLSEYRKRRDLLVQAATQAGFRCRAPAGAFYLFADVRERMGQDSWAAMETLLARTGIATVPGSVFGAEGEGHLRMSYSTSLETLEQAAAALRQL